MKRKIAITKVLAVYGLWGSVRLLFQLLSTKLFYREARLIRQPCYIRGRRRIRLGQGLTTGVGLRLDAFENGEVVLGRGVELNDHVHIAAIERVSIGDDTLIASRVFISDHNHGRFDTALPEHGADIPPAMRPLHSKPVHIGKRVWIGEGVCVLPGVTIGDGAVIGAGSIVTRDVPAGCVVVGNPATVIRCFDMATQTWKFVR